MDSEPNTNVTARAAPPVEPGRTPSAGTDLGIEINLIPDEAEVALAQAPSAREARNRSLWHRVRPRSGILVSLGSRDERLRVVRLTVASEARGWNARWARWSYAARRTPADRGGDALAAQDGLSADETQLTLLMLPGERRSATLDFIAELDGETWPGDLRFDVVATDVSDGSVQTQPALLKLRHPRSTLLYALPSIYADALRQMQLDAGPGEDSPFFERYLRGFEDAIEPLQYQVSHLDAYFDPDGAPEDFLPWLATWVTLALDENWPQLKRRRLIKEIVELYRWRGTRYGLSRYLELYTGVLPQINDQPFAGMRLGSDTLLGYDTILGDVPPHTFVITLAVANRDAINERVVKAIIESEKPAHAAYTLQIVERVESD